METGLTKFQENQWVLSIRQYGIKIMEKSLLSLEQKRMLIEMENKMKGGIVMDRHMAADLDRYITGNYGEDQFKDDPYHIYKNFELNWKIGDQWAPKGDDKYILARMNDPRIKDLFYTQFINTRTGNRYSEEVIIRNHHGKKDCCVFTISEICCLIYGRDISISTTDDDNVRLDDLENAHKYGPEWE